MIHREGKITIPLTIVGTLILYWLLYSLVPFLWPLLGILAAGVIFWAFWFFRNPNRNTPINDNNIIAPADGKVVVIEEVEEPEYFKDRRIQISIFMSPINVHVNRNPIGGLVKYAKYHEGKYLVAWHPKSSTENERTTMVVESDKGTILFRQIAGAMARRILYYLKEGIHVKQGEEFGFIKFGSRVDVFLPLSSKINVKIDQKVVGGETVIGRFSS